MPRLKVKDMPRKQQMAVKATMADGGKGNPNKLKVKLEDAVKVKKSKPRARVKFAGFDQTGQKIYRKETTGLEKMPQLKAKKLKTSPALAKLSASCKAAARRKFKVYPSAYANMWASRTQKKGKC